MPSPQLKIRRRREQWTTRHLKFLGRGPYALGPWVEVTGSNDAVFNRAMADVRRCWDAFETHVMERWIASRPGTRPWAWWAFEAPEPRRLVSGPGCRALTDSDAPAWTQRLSFGMPTVIGSEAEWRNEWESEWSYLSRLRLLTPAERKHGQPAEDYDYRNSAWLDSPVEV